MPSSRLLPILLVLPALALVLALFVYPLFYSLLSAFAAKDGSATLGNFAKVIELYTTDIIFTAVIVGISTVLIGACAGAIGGYLILGENPRAVAALKFLYRWPLVIPFIVAAQCVRPILAKNRLLNNAFDTLGVIDVQNASGLLDWRGIIVTFVWKQTPFVALLVPVSMAALDLPTIDAARNLGASRPRILVEIVLPEV